MEVLEIGADGAFDIGAPSPVPSVDKSRANASPNDKQGDHYMVYKCEDALTHEKMCECRIVFRSEADMPAVVDLQQDGVVYQHKKLGCRRIELPRLDIQTATVFRSEEKKTIFVRAALVDA